MCFCFLAGCASDPKIDLTSLFASGKAARDSELGDVPEDSVTRAKPPAKAEEITLPGYVQPRTEVPLPKAEPVDTTVLTRETKPVTINVESMPLSDFIVQGIGNTLKVTFYMDEAVKNMKNPVTLKMAAEMPAPAALEIALDVLRQQNLIVEQKGGALYILQSKPQPRQPLDIRIGSKVSDSPANIVQILPVKHLNAQEIAGLAGEIFKTNVITKVYFKENSLMFSGAASAIREIVDFISIMDVPYLREKRPFLVQLVYWQPDEFVKQMTTILQGLGFSVSTTAMMPGILFIPIKYLNSVLIVAPDEKTMKVVLDWKNRLDTAESAGTEEKAFTFSPRYSRASELVDSIRRLYGISTTPVIRSFQTQAGQQPLMQQAGAQIAPMAPVQQPQAQQQPVAGAGQAQGMIPGLKISADDRKNLVILMTTPSTYKSILPILTDLDRPPKQVLIETTIAEITLKDDLAFGFEWYIRSRMADGTSTISTLNKLGRPDVGLAYTFIADSQNVQVAFNALAKENKINLLSTPRIMVVDNEEATINIGTDVPLLSGSTTSTNPDTQNIIATQAVQYRTTGLTLRVKPTINTEGLLSLSLSLEVSQPQTNTTSKIDSPLFLQRKLSTNVVATTRQTIFLGGIMSEDMSSTETKVPLLGDIPLLGLAFKSESKSKNKTELIIMLTPVIITSTDDAVQLTNQIRQTIQWIQ